MPWEIKENDGEYCIHRKDTGAKVKCHPTRQAAMAQMAAMYANEPEAAKAGARHSTGDKTDMQTMHDIAVRQGAKCDPQNMPEPMPIGKAEDLPNISSAPIIFGVVKAAGEWELDVLANPYGGPNDGRDADGQYFSTNTKFHEDQIPLPPVVYYHGYGDDKRPMGLPEFIGKTARRWTDGQGVWYRVVLNRASAFAQRVWDAAQRGAARASTGVVLASHRVDQKSGEILSWLNGELSIFETDSGKRPANGYAVALPALKAVYDQAGLVLPVIAEPETDTRGAASPVAVVPSPLPDSTTEKNNMDEKDILALLEKREKERKEAEAAETERQAKEQQRIDTAVVAAVEKAKQEYLKAGRLHMGDPVGPHVAKFADTRPYDHYEQDDLGFVAVVLSAAKRQNAHLHGVSKNLLKALAIRLAEDKTVLKRKDGTDIPLGEQGRAAMKAGGLEPADVLDAQKADELDYSTQAGFGDEWVTVNYSNRLWEAVRYGTFVLDKMPTVEVPQGAESIIIPLEGADPTWYKVAQTTANNATTLRPDATVTASKLATAQKTLSVVKMGARTEFSGELEEDSIIPWAAQLRRQLETSGAEALENVIINGDTDETASTNINAIDTTPAATALYILFNGFRKSPLVTTTANSRSAAGAFVDTDFLATVKLMGAAGKNAQDHSKVEFIVDMNTYWKALELANLKVKNLFDNYTLLNGELTSIWGYKVRPSGHMHANSAKLMANSAGKIDADTDSNNTLGAILAVRYDQWLFGYKRRMTIETQRWIDADATQIVALARVGLAQRDVEASAISYNVLV